jgi:hypothetical protein
MLMHRVQPCARLNGWSGTAADAVPRRESGKTPPMIDGVRQF